MRIAVFSDVHGNLTALKAVLADIGRKRVDQTIFAGDLCLVGPLPAACLQEIQEAGVFCIYGNTDDWILGRQKPPDHLKDLAKWTLAQLDESQREWLDGLPFSILVSPVADGLKDLLIFHANPVDVNQQILPSEVQQLALYGRIRQNDQDLNNLLNGTKGAVLAFGHLHIPGVRDWNHLRLINISSVSMPGDADPRAKYGLFTWQGGDWQFERRKVAFDISQEIAAYRRERPPGWENIVETIEREGTFPQRV